MGRKGVTFQQVAAAADEMLGQGVEPSNRLVRERLGTGSLNTIHRHFITWGEARPRHVVGIPELPASVTKAFASEIERAVAEVRALGAHALTQSQTESSDLAQEAAVLEDERDFLLDRVATLTSEKEQALELALERQEIIDRQAAEIERERKFVGDAQTEAAFHRLKAEECHEKTRGIGNERDQLSKELDATKQALHTSEVNVAIFEAKLNASEVRTLSILDWNETIASELENTRAMLMEALRQARIAGEEAAELRGKYMRDIPLTNSSKSEIEKHPAQTLADADRKDGELQLTIDSTDA
jgi:colicin import membrane protein